MALKRILLAVHDSEQSLKAVDFAAGMVSGQETEIIVMDVVTERKLVSQALWDNIKSTYEALATEVLTAVVSRLADKGVKNVQAEVGDGDPASVIIQMAEKLKADAIVIGGHGRGPLRGFLTNDLSYKVLSKADCAVIVVK